ncbi:hypothetical protein PVIIG_06134 [Plasmodium vivax India VII]|uniref:Uncharacterized protein n=1 Tax=Plasmodium vivax India VII TaxID=1077284 RepID=A0A0J9SKA7_PLAVI|nr:hypothetical protein PVIIG_06134 [Plasmodium vivax India VII]
MSTQKSCFQSDNIYLDYKCYNRLYKYFNDDYIFRNNEEKLEIISPKIDIKPYHRKEQRQIFNKLYQYMGGDSVFGWENQTECCKYVNYWLNDKVEKNIIALYDEKSFKIFQDIVQLYNKNNPGKTKCISDIKFIDTEYLRRMGALYSLYDKYYSLISNTIRYPYKPCDLIDQASGIFKDTINEHGDNDNNLLTRLKEFKPLMDSIVPNYTCTSNYRKHFIIPEKFSENKVTKPENMEQEEETSAHPLVSGTGQEKQQVLESRGQSSNSEVNLLSETLTLGTEEEARGDSRPITETLSQQDLGSYNELSHSGDGRRSVGADSVKLDHSLEEEEDDSVKFLVVSMDHSQEISQIFRNMVVVLLDIVQWI